MARVFSIPAGRHIERADQPDLRPTPEKAPARAELATGEVARPTQELQQPPAAVEAPTYEMRVIERDGNGRVQRLLLEPVPPGST